MLAGGRQGGGCRGAQKSLPPPGSQRERRRAIGGIGRYGRGHISDSTQMSICLPCRARRRGRRRYDRTRSTGCQAGPSRFPLQHAQRRPVLGTPWSAPRRRWLGACRRPARSASVVEPSAGLAGMAVGIYRTRRKCLFAYHAGPAGEGAGATTAITTPGVESNDHGAGFGDAGSPARCPATPWVTLPQTGFSCRWGQPARDPGLPPRPANTGRVVDPGAGLEMQSQ
jgi:hypothetical protein